MRADYDTGHAALREKASANQPRSGPPRFAGRVGERIAALVGYKAFLAEYRDARARWLTGLRATFPRGTYWLTRFAAVPVTGPPS